MDKQDSTADPLLSLYLSSLPPEISSQLSTTISSLQSGSFKAIFDSRPAALLLGWRDDTHTSPLTLGNSQRWTDWLLRRLEALTSSPRPDADLTAHTLFLVAVAALQAFVQSNVTGPPLHWRPTAVLWPDWLQNARSAPDERSAISESMGVDGVAAYSLTPNIELWALADCIFAAPAIKERIPASTLASLRVNVLHQRLLSETSSTLQGLIYDTLESVEQLLKVNKGWYSHFLVERSAIHTLHGLPVKARADLQQAAELTRFEFALTGVLGKRTKWQDRDVSQLVVLACSSTSPTGTENGQTDTTTTTADDKPTTLDLNDDTLLDAISFTGPSTDIAARETLPPQLLNLDPNAQPRLAPLDSVILLQLASSITNTSPSDGLTREETLPYATRVLDGGSANWQVYTQALLVRSRVEGYRARTTERGLLQLQALVDQVIADTLPETPTGLTPAVEKTNAADAAAASFLPRPSASESAPASARLAYVYALSTPTRRELEAELAQRWVSLGGLRSALDIYERLQMPAEAALCWAATDREDRARALLKRQLNFQAGGPNALFDPAAESWDGPARDPPPADAPRLYCILGDIDGDAEMYQRAWRVSGGRYARAQRSLGRLFWSGREYEAAAAAYTAALGVSKIHRPTWFALGCCLLELDAFSRAVDAFARAVQLDDSDAEAWSNLAVALLKRGPVGKDVVRVVRADDDDDDEEDESGEPETDKQSHLHDALRALTRAATLKQDSARIWENVLTVASSLDPPVYSDVLTAQSQLVSLTAKTAGESAVDAASLERLVRHVVSTYPSAPELARLSRDENGVAAHRPGSLPARCVALVTGQVAPLITRSARLWRVVATLALWQGKPGTALDAHEKAWRAATGPGAAAWEAGESGWATVVEETVALVDAYEALGPRERTEGLAAGSGQVVMRDCKFKARSAARGILGRGKEWEGTEAHERLRGVLEGLKAGSS